jgi:hypothetical protein
MMTMSSHVHVNSTASVLPSTVCAGQRVPKDTSTLKLPRSGDKIVLWNYDIPSSRMNVNLYGSQPFIMAVEPGGVLS